jgi:hypothetical protein
VRSGATSAASNRGTRPLIAPNEADFAAFLHSVRLLMRTRHVNGLLIAAILVISTAPLYAQRQQQNVAKLKADARNLVGIIGSDKTKTQT